MRINRIKAYLIDLLILLIIYTLINTIIPQPNELKKYKSMEREVSEKYMEQEITLTEYLDQYEVIYYKINENRKINNAIYLIFLLGYFVILPYYTNGQTLGLYLNKLRIEKFTDGKIKLYQYFVRNVVIVGLGYATLNTILIYFLNQRIYYNIISIISVIQILLLITSWIMVIRKREKRGLHEIFSNTEIVSLRKKQK